MAKTQGASPKKGAKPKEQKPNVEQADAVPVIPTTIGIGMPISEEEMKKLKKAAKKL